MSERTGLGPLEAAVLRLLDDLGAGWQAGYQRTTRLLDRLEHDHHLGARYTYPLVQDLGARWRLHLPLLDCNGNWGGAQGGPAADPRYTELRLSPVGALALAAEREQNGPLPLGLIEGSLYRGGPVPPFAPIDIVAALSGIVAYAAPPRLPTGGTVTGDIAGLLAGQPARLTLGCTIITEGASLVITEVPLGVPVSVREISEYLANRLSRTGRPRPSVIFPNAPVLPQPWRITDESSARSGIRIVCTPPASLDESVAFADLRDVWPVSISVDCQLPAPMTERLAAWDHGDGTGLVALSNLLA